MGKSTNDWLRVVFKILWDLGFAVTSANWQGLLTLVGALSVMTYVAYLTDWVRSWGPFGILVAALASLLVFATGRLLWNLAVRESLRSKWIKDSLRAGSNVNPLDSNFHGVRIFLKDFVLVSDPLIQDKTFIDCDLVGPAILWVRDRNQATDNREPRVDAVVRKGEQPLFNVIMLSNCRFIRCSFQRITLVFNEADYEGHAKAQWLNWVGFTPEERQFPHSEQQDAVEQPDD